MNETILMLMLEAVMLFFMIFGLIGVNKKKHRGNKNSTKFDA